jgi:hypothetical protein
MRMHVQCCLQSVRSIKIFKDVTCFCTETWDFAVSDLGIKVCELANECLSVVSDRTVIYCFFMGGQPCLMENLQEPIQLSVNVLLILFMLVLNIKCDDMFSRTSR